MNVTEASSTNSNSQPQIQIRMYKVGFGDCFLGHAPRAEPHSDRLRRASRRR